VQPCWTGHYINLDRARDRRTSIERQLRKGQIHQAYRRFSAIEGKKAPRGQSPLTPGEIGCFRSHTEVLEIAGREQQWVHVLEDDAVLSRSFGPMVRDLIRAGLFERYDLVFTDIILGAPDLISIRGLEAEFRRSHAAAPDVRLSLLDLRTANPVGTNSYFVNPASLEKVGAILRVQLDGGGPMIPLDWVYQREIQAGRLRAACVFPFLTSVHLKLASASQIRDDTPVWSSGSDLLRYAFSLGCDIDEIRSAAAALRVKSRGDSHLDHLIRVIRLIISSPPGEARAATRPESMGP
jgi:hypothetical protein